MTTVRMRRWCAFAASLLMAGIPCTAARAQVVRGVVVDGANRAVSGVVVALIDSTQAVVARALSDDRGAYRVAAPRAGTYRLRTLRIGFQPMLSAPMALIEGGVTDERLTLDGVRVSLETIRVVERGVCGRVGGVDAGQTFAAWDQAMTSVAATSLTSSARGLTATTMQIERMLEPNGRRVVNQNVVVRTDYVTQPWRSLAPDTLRRRGYTTVDANDVTTFYAPGLDALVSPRFLEDHCVALVKARDTTEIGVAFDPVPERRLLSEIRGTLWLSRATAELKRLDFTFTRATATSNATSNATTNAFANEFTAGGAMTFTRLDGGAIAISAWEIRMPQLTKDSPKSTKVRVESVASSGGQLVVLRRGADTLFKRASLTVSGVVLDSASGNPLTRAAVSLAGTTSQSLSGTDGRFTMTDVLPGEYTLTVRTPSLDSVRASSQSAIVAIEGMPTLNIKVPTAAQLAATLCGPSLAGSSGRGKGAVLGAVRADGDTIGLTGVRVVADWTEIVTRSGGAGSIQQSSRRLETRSGAGGGYRLCGVPTETALTVRAMPDSGRSQPAAVRLSPDQRFASQGLVVDRAKAAVASFTGTVVADSSFKPLADAEVSVPTFGLSTRSNVRGEFRLTDVPTGTHDILVRRVGFGAISVPMTFAANDEELRRIVLRPLTVLDSIDVVATRLDPGLSDFEANRKVGLGSFLTRDFLEKQGGRRMGDVVAQMSGAGIVQGRSGAWILSKRYVIPISAASGRESAAIWKPSETERLRGLIAGCYAQVYVDNHLMNPGQPTEPYDVNAMVSDQIESIEWYASPAQTPARYAKLNSPCGVMVIHTRRVDSLEQRKTPPR